MVTSANRGSRAAPVRKATASATSSALPAVQPRHWPMSVKRARQGSPAPAATAISSPASASAAAAEGKKAPEPSLTSITRPASPAASFLARIEATISGIDSTVAVTSRIA